MRRGDRLSLLSQTQGWGLLPSSMVTVVTSSRTLQPTFRLLQTSAVRDHLKARLTLYLEPALDKRLRAEAARHDLTIGRYVTHLLLSRPGVEIRSPIEARRVATTKGWQVARVDRGGAEPAWLSDQDRQAVDADERVEAAPLLIGGSVVRTAPLR